MFKSSSREGGFPYLSLEYVPGILVGLLVFFSEGEVCVGISILCMRTLRLGWGVAQTLIYIQPSYR
jgi:hypothetical protein